MRRIAGLLAALALVAGTTDTAARAVASPTVYAAKKCHHGYKHAVIGGKHKCLHAGEFCTHKYDSQYRNYGFRCTKYYANVQRYRLTKA